MECENPILEQCNVNYAVKNIENTKFLFHSCNKWIYEEKCEQDDFIGKGITGWIIAGAILVLAILFWSARFYFDKEFRNKDRSGLITRKVWAKMNNIFSKDKPTQQNKNTNTLQDDISIVSSVSSNYEPKNKLFLERKEENTSLMMKSLKNIYNSFHSVSPKTVEKIFKEIYNMESFPN